LSARLVLNAECLKLTSLNFDRMKREASLLEPNELELLELRSIMLYGLLWSTKIFLTLYAGDREDFPVPFKPFSS
jgi:hypothetical protein